MKIDFERTKVYNILNAIWGAREALNSHDKMDTKEVVGYEDDGSPIIMTVIGENDMRLCKRLIGAKDPSERKFLRTIHVSVRITAPAYWYAELDTYKVATVRLSSSFMHKGTVRPYEHDDFESVSDNALVELNELRGEYLNAKTPEYKKEVFEALRSAMPSGYLYKSTMSFNYETIMTMFKQRKNHRLSHWRKGFCIWALSLPYMREFLLAAGIIDENYEPKE